MLLARREILKAVTDRRIRFDPPVSENQIGETSIDLRLGYTFVKIRPQRGITISPSSGLSALKGLFDTYECPATDSFGRPSEFVMEPSEFILGVTLEAVALAKDIVGVVEGRSTYARLGMSMHQTAPWIQPGWEGQITLEFMNVGPLRLALKPSIDRPCQLSFMTLSSELDGSEAYGAKTGDAYQAQTHPLPNAS